MENNIPQITCKGIYLLGTVKVVIDIIRDTFVCYKECRAGKYTKGECFGRFTAGIFLSLTGVAFYCYLANQ